MTGPPSPAICVIDDDDAVRDSLSELLRSYEFRVQDFGSALEFLANRQEHDANYACVVSDLHMPGMSGLELLELLQTHPAPIPFVMITGHADNKVKERARRAGVTAVLDKPVAEEALIALVDRAVASRSVLTVAGDSL